MDFKTLFISICCLILLSCSDSTDELNEKYGPAQTRDRLFDYNRLENR